MIVERLSSVIRHAGLLGCVLVATFLSPYAGAFDHSGWDKLLKANVVLERGGVASTVDYAEFSRQRADLGQYLESLAAVDRAQFDRWSANEQLAFLINAYNAWTVELILTAYPDLESIRDLGSIFRSPWKKKIVRLFGDEFSLDDIEHGMIREPGRFDEPRIHFAVNCASIGCPALRTEAFRGDALDAQLEAATKAFFSDHTRNRVGSGGLEVTSLLDWYEDDFAGPWDGVPGVRGFLLRYRSELGLDDSQSGALAAGELSIRHLEYDWALNDVES